MKHVSDRWVRHVVPTLGIAVPVMFSRAGLLLMIAVDTAMCGQLGQSALAYYGLGAAAQVPLMLFGIGMMMGVSVMTAQAYGAGQSHRTGTILLVGLIHACVYGCALFVLCLFGEDLLLLTGQSTEIAAGGGRVVAHFGWGLPAALIFSALAFSLEAIHRPLPAVIVMFAANIVNFALNSLLMYSDFTLGLDGASAAAVATSAVRWLMCATLAAYIYYVIDADHYGLRKASESISKLGTRFRKMGYPMALGQGLESSSFAIMAIFAGWMGASAIGAWSIGMNVLALLFMLALGFTTASGVRVANAVGRYDRREVLLAGWTGFGLCVCMQIIVGALVYQYRQDIALIYSNDTLLLPIVISTLALAALVMIPDGLQAVLVGMLRGASDFWSTALAQFVAFWIVMLPIGYWLGVVEGFGALGLMAAVGIGAMFAVIVLIARFVWVTKYRFSAS